MKAQAKRDAQRQASAHVIAKHCPASRLRETLASWIVTAAQLTDDASYWAKRAKRAERKLEKLMRAQAGGGGK